MRSIIATALFLAFTTGAVASDEAPAARQYFNEILESIEALEHEMPTITSAADGAAERFLRGANIGIRGGAGLNFEFTQRPGGIAVYRGDDGGPGDVILHAFGPMHALADRSTEAEKSFLKREIQQAAKLRQQGCYVIGIASREQLTAHDLWEVAENACDVVIDNRVQFHLPREKRAPIEASLTVMNAAAVWTWQCEFFAACARRDKPPVMLKSFDIDYRKRRFNRYSGMRVHMIHDVPAIEPGILGHQYLKELHETLLDVGTASWGDLSRTAHRAADTIDAGGVAYIRAGTTYLAHHHDGQVLGDDDPLVGLNHDGSNPSLPKPGPNDFVIVFGYVDPPGSGWWGEPEMFRKAGRGVAWVANGYFTDRRRHLARGEILIDQQWTEGDTLIKPAGYDIRIGSASGIISDAIYFAIVEQIRADLKAFATTHQANESNAEPRN